ncbi:MAG: hypothetical protein KatS3mg027_0453 [Bacteroidia bacterium]|nr:MAG: hypothetical protein KatS3mg027_0453 [Bacteroidia bacterium]
MDSEKLNILANQWLFEKKQRMKNLLKIALPDEALYREIMLSLGYPSNKLQFLELALLLPYKYVQKLHKQPLIEKALLYRAGFIQDYSGLPEDFDTSLKLDKSYWSYKGTRPANFPDKRIKDISSLLAETTQTGIYQYFKNKLETVFYNDIQKLSAKKTVEKIMSFQGIGISRKREMFFNIILPFFMADTTSEKYHPFLMEIFETHPSLSINKKIKSFITTHNIQIKNTKEYFGIIYSFRVKDS